MPTVISGSTGVSKVQDGIITADKLASGAITTDSVLPATASATAGAVGTYASAFRVVSGTLAVGATVAGSSLRVVEGASGTIVTFPFGGTWRNMGGSLIGTTGYGGMMTTVLRIA